MAPGEETPAGKEEMKTREEVFSNLKSVEAAEERETEDEVTEEDK